MSAEYHDEDDHEKNERECIDDFDDAHHQRIDVSGGIARDSAIGDTDGQGHERGKQAHGERNAASDECPCKKIAAVGVGSE
jgi:hypothetical protein